MFTKISHITLFVQDQEKALAFYKKLGFTVHTDAPFGPMRWLTITLPGQKDVEVALLLAETAQEKALVGKQASDKPLLSFESTDAQKDYEMLQGMGIADLEKPKTEPWGISFGFKDLYGNAIYVCQPK